jgi:hypothetical protein
MISVILKRYHASIGKSAATSLMMGRLRKRSADGGLMEVTSGGSTGSTPITFTNAGGILQLDASPSFNGLVAGFGSPYGVIEEIDLRDIAFGKKTKLSFKEAQGKLSGTLTVTDGTHTTNLTLLGRYSISDFSLSSDGHGDTIIKVPVTRIIKGPVTRSGGHPHWPHPREGKGSTARFCELMIAKSDGCSRLASASARHSSRSRSMSARAIIRSGIPTKRPQ